MTEIRLETDGDIVGITLKGLGYRPNRTIVIITMHEHRILSAYQMEYSNTRPMNVTGMAAAMAAEQADKVVMVGFEATEDESLEPAARLAAALDEVGVRLPDDTPLLTVRGDVVYRPLEEGHEPSPVNLDLPDAFHPRGGVPGQPIMPSRSAMLAQWQSVVDEIDVYPIGDDPSDGMVAEGAQAWAKACQGEELTQIEVAAAATAARHPLFRTALVLRLAPESLAVSLLTAQMRDYAEQVEMPGDKRSRFQGMQFLATHLQDRVESCAALYVIGHYLWWEWALDPALAVLERIERFQFLPAMTLLMMLRSSVSPDRMAEIVRARAAAAEQEREE